MNSSDPLILVADGGGTKTDLALLNARGELLAQLRIGPLFQRHLDWRTLDNRLRRAEKQLRSQAGIGSTRRVAELGVFCLAGINRGNDSRQLEQLLLRQKIIRRAVIRNDTLAMAFAGAGKTWGIGVVCGTGTNASFLLPSEKLLYFYNDLPGSYIWGGGPSVGFAALGAACKQIDGRGPQTLLTQMLEDKFKRDVVRISRIADRLKYWNPKLSVDWVARNVAPMVFEAALCHDEAALQIVEQLRSQIVELVRVLMNRSGILTRKVPATFGGSVILNQRKQVYDPVRAVLEAEFPNLQCSLLKVKPIYGAARYGLNLLNQHDPAIERNLKKHFSLKV